VEEPVALPDFLVVGAPKAGSTAVHQALVEHPRLFLSDPKEPKYFLTPDERPRRANHRGPGDAHSAQEWVWQRDRYERLFDNAPERTLRGESTPFYLWDMAAHRRIFDAVPHAKLIAIIRDPVDRAYSNWTHLRSDGLEPEADFSLPAGSRSDELPPASHRSGATSSSGATASSSSTCSAFSRASRCTCCATRS
jgi:hypothetical protein